MPFLQDTVELLSHHPPAVWNAEYTLILLSISGVWKSTERWRKAS
jgi:hypothetical protein